MKQHNMKVSSKYFELLKEFEGFRSKPYQDTGGVWSIGYGSTILPNGKRVRSDTPAITEDQAEDYVEQHMQKLVYPAIDELVSVDLTQGQFDALADFIYNAGYGNFLHSTLRTLVNKSDFTGAAKQFDRWVYVNGKVLPGLVKRANAREALFTGTDAVVADTKPAATNKQKVKRRGSV